MTEKSVVSPGHHQPSDQCSASQLVSKSARERTKVDRMSATNTADMVPEAAAPVQQHQEEASQYADDGDGDFIPVVKEKRKNKNEKQGPGAAAAVTGTGEKASAKSGKSGHSSSRRRGRRSAASAAAAASAGAAAGAGGGSGAESGQPETGGGASDNGTADEHSNDENPKKFVEAPIPAVNVWKVSTKTIIYCIMKTSIHPSSKRRRLSEQDFISLLEN